MRNALCVCLLIAFALPALPAESTDAKDIESAVLGVYNVISGPAGPRDWEHFKALFADGARLGSLRDGKLTLMTPDDYIARAQPHFDKDGFFEKPVETRIDQFKDIAHVTSRYESRRAAADEKPFARGVNHFELARIGGQWRVVSIIWQQE
ncbi:MAG TPA: nuclear transport factor 2 family protein [Thermoanaerobaculia bacterium]|nr:nuclear transport factor 2 family protein [Thermoanaerobaculia bacterium]